MKAMNKGYFFLVLVLVVAASCSKKPDVEYTDTYKMAGEWFTRYYQDGVAVTPYHKIISYNTSEVNSGKIWVEDGVVWPFRGKFDVDYGSLAFKAMASTNNLEAAGETIKVFEGKVLPGAGRSKTGVAVDSIYLKVEFSDDPGAVYEIRGHHRTGFFEDEFD